MYNHVPCGKRDFRHETVVAFLTPLVPKAWASGLRRGWVLQVVTFHTLETRFVPLLWSTWTWTFSMSGTKGWMPERYGRWNSSWAA